MVYKLATVITQEGKFFIARAVELGVVSQGKNVPEALANLKEAVELFFDNNPRAKKLASKKAPFVTTLELQHV